MVASPLDRVHVRLDQLLAELSLLSQRVAKVEAQEFRLAETSRDLDLLEERVNSMSIKLAKLEVNVLETRALIEAAQNGSRSKEYVEKGGLVLGGGAVVEIIRQVVLQLFKN